MKNCLSQIMYLTTLRSKLTSEVQDVFETCASIALKDRSEFLTTIRFKVYFITWLAGCTTLPSSLNLSSYSVSVHLRLTDRSITNTFCL